MIGRKESLARVSLLMLSLVLFISAGIAACNSGGSPPAEQMEIEDNALPPLPEVVEELPPEILLPSFLEVIAEKYALNSDTIGWLYVPGTSIDDVVLHYPHDANEFYLRRNFEGRTSMAGSYFADFRNTFNGLADGLSRNTIIYGHSLNMDDDPDAPYFDQLKRFLDEDFARQNPYIFFSVAEQDLMWEVFAVYYTTTSLPYNMPEFTDVGFAAIIEEMTARSEFIYDVQVLPEDRILTLSTCTYVFTPGVYPNRYRFVISARLVEEGEELRQEANLERNPSPRAP